MIAGFPFRGLTTTAGDVPASGLSKMRPFEAWFAFAAAVDKTIAPVRLAAERARQLYRKCFTALAKTANRNASQRSVAAGRGGANNQDNQKT